MSPKERAALSDQILTNPVFGLAMAHIERAAIERCILAPPNDHETRSSAAAEVRAIRAFRQNLEASLQDNQPRKVAPA